MSNIIGHWTGMGLNPIISLVPNANHNNQHVEVGAGNMGSNPIISLDPNANYNNQHVEVGAGNMGSSILAPNLGELYWNSAGNLSTYCDSAVTIGGNHVHNNYTMSMGRLAGCENTGLPFPEFDGMFRPRSDTRRDVIMNADGHEISIYQVCLQVFKLTQQYDSLWRDYVRATFRRLLPDDLVDMLMSGLGRDD